MRPDDPVDLTNCDREPIHVPGAIQPHGALLACQGPDLTVVQVSDNVASHLAQPADAILGRPIADVLSAGSRTRLMDAAAAGFPREMNPLILESRTGTAFDGIVHNSVTPGIAVVEFEPKLEALIGFHPRTRASMRRLQDASDIRSLCDVAAREIKTLTGFDRVMVYRFDRDWNGEVVAEARRPDLEPFLGLHYPAADIPAQARRLYTLNWLRIIPDISYRPSRLVPTVLPGADAPLDLSFSVLRSVSSIHVEYLRNMGVTASMSVSLIRDDALIGLIACHHYSGPHYVPFVVRESAEFLGQALSWHLASFESREAAERALATQRSESKVIGALSSARSIPEGLCTPALLELTASSGVALVYEGRVHDVGRAPSSSQVRRILDVMAPADSEWLSVTERLGDLLPGAESWDDVAAGVLVVEISRDLGEYVLWFRQATDRAVNWAGDPRKIEDDTDASGAPRLSPRGSFALWREIVKGRSLPWESWQVEAASNLRKLLVSGIRRRADELRVINEQLSEADRLKDEFLATVGHELRTPLNAMLGWLHMLRTGTVAADRRERALDTIERNARAQGELIDDLLDISRIVAGKLKLTVQPVELGSLMERALDGVRPAADAKGIRLQSALDSTAIILGDAHRLQQVAANLLTNAVKFTPKGGRVQVFVERNDSSVEVTVADTGQGIAASLLPYVFERFRQGDAGIGRKSTGLGLGLAIVRHIVELHGGTVSAQSEGEGRGSTFMVRLPLSVAARRASALPVSPASGARDLECPSELAGLRLLVMDDEPDARDVLRTLLEHCGSTVTTAASVAEGLALVDSFAPDAIVSDIGMPDEDGYSFIQRLRARPADQGGRIPVVALTAHARAEDRARALYAGFNNHVPKPVEPIELFAVIAALFAGRQGGPR